MEEIGQLKPKEIKFPKILHWSRLIFLTGSTQLFIQALGLVSGIVIIRFLPTKEYAFYTLVNTMLGTMTVLSDGGISAGVMAQGGQVWQDFDKLGQVVVTGFYLRKRFAILSLLVCIPILLYLLINHGASWLMALLIVLTLIPAFMAALSDTLLEIGPKLWQDIKALQFNQAFVASFRLILIGIVFLFPWAAFAILAAGIPRMVGNFKLRKISAKYINWNQKPDPIIKKEILSVVKRLLPGAIYYCVSGQITLWLISIFGSTQAIAHIGALGRLVSILTIFATLFNTLFTPRFARLKQDSKLLLLRFGQIQLALLILSFIIIGIVFLFPRQVTWILGKDYNNLDSEILLITISSCLTMVTGVCYSLLVSRGWVINPLINISINIFFQILLLFTLDLTKTKNVLMFSIVDYLVAYIILIIYFLVRFYKRGQEVYI